jgi:methylenetetrahydrofolate dehydrogenase (NADP+) / methenyltetrahydrofolate cyclohydrolase
MSATILDGTAVAKRRLAALKRRARRGLGLGIIVATDNPATAAYIRNKQRQAEAVGFRVEIRDLGASASRPALLAACRTFNRSRLVTGYIVQLPLPAGLDSLEIFAAVDPNKDADGLTATNLGYLYTNRPRILPATPKGILSLLAAYRVPLAGKRATIVGKGLLTGLPIATLLAHRDVTVTSCDKHTRNLASQTASADILVAAAGSPGLITARHVKPGAVVIDVGATRLKTRFTGDVAFPSVAKKAGSITPVPGGIGPMTVASLLENVDELSRL